MILFPLAQHSRCCSVNERNSVLWPLLIVICKNHSRCFSNFLPFYSIKLSIYIPEEGEEKEHTKWMLRESLRNPRVILFRRKWILDKSWSTGDILLLLFFSPQKEKIKINVLFRSLLNCVCDRQFLLTPCVFMAFEIVLIFVLLCFSSLFILFSPKCSIFNSRCKVFLFSTFR